MWTYIVETLRANPQLAIFITLGIGYWIGAKKFGSFSLGVVTSTLLASLWPVSDAATETLMTTLYDDLAKGESVQDAMRDAQRAVLANPETAHPFFWAPFNLIGNWRLKVQK